MAIDILSIWLLVAAGVQLGTLWIMKTSIVPLLDALPHDRYVTTCQLIDMHVFHPIALWNGVAAAGIAAVLAFLVPSGPATVLLVVGAVAMLLVGATSEGVNRPIWRQIEMWSPRRASPGWADKRRTWHVAHDVRTFSALAAVLAFAGSALAVLVF